MLVYAQQQKNTRTAAAGQAYFLLVEALPQTVGHFFWNEDAGFNSINERIHRVIASGAYQLRI